MLPTVFISPLTNLFISFFLRFAIEKVQFEEQMVSFEMQTKHNGVGYSFFFKKNLQSSFLLTLIIISEAFDYVCFYAKVFNMKTYTLNVPVTQEMDDWFSFIDIELYNLHSTSNLNLLIVDFQTVGFLQTDDFVVLACLIELFSQKGCEIEFTGGTTKFNHHLFNIKFKEYWKQGFNREEFTIAHNQNTLCLWKINRERIEPYSHFAEEYFKSNFLENKNILPFASNLTEVFNNIFDHSKASVSYIITQYFPKVKELSFSLCDFGIGIPSSVNSYLSRNGQPVLEDWDAIQKAIQLGFSVKSIPRNQGRGLDNLLSMVESLNGTILIISNNGVLQRSPGNKMKVGSFGYNFSGTLIKVIIKKEAFETEDNEELTWGF